MTIPTDYTSLQTWIADWMNRPDLTAVLPDFVKLAEGQMNAKLKVTHNEVSTTLTLSNGSSSITLPSDYLEAESLSITDSYANQPLKRDTTFVDRLRNFSGVLSGRPLWWAVVTSPAAIIFERTANQDYSVFFRYFKRWDLATDTTNWVLTYKPEIYMDLCMKYASLYVRDANGAQFWGAEADRIIDALIQEDRRDRNKQMEARVDSALIGHGRPTWRSGYDILTDTFTGSQ